MNTPDSEVSPETRLEECYELNANSTEQVGKLTESETSGWVNLRAELDGETTIERWISIPTRFVWTIDIAPGGAFTWRSSGVE